MQIAQIVPKVKTKSEGIFDYDIGPEILPNIKVGILVLVPFHGRKVEGIIVKIKKSSKIENLKKIIKIINPNPVVDDIHLKLALWMSDFYLEPLSKTLFENTVPQAIRSIPKENLDIKKNELSQIIPSIKNYLVISDFQNRLKFYLKKINETLKNKKQVLILVPDLTNIAFFKKNLPLNTIVLHANMTKTERFKAWQKIQEGKTSIVLGSLSTLFAPLSNLGLIIIDQEEAETYKNDRSPRFHVVESAKELSKLTNASLVIGSIAPRLETFFLAKKENYQILTTKKTNKSKISIIDMNSEKEILSFPLKEKIGKYLQLKRRILLVLNRKDEKSRFICSDCGYQNIFPIPQNCPKCQSPNLKQLGVSIGRLKNIVLKNFPQAKAIIVADEKKYNFLPQNNWDIAIATSFILKFPLPPISFVGVIDIDQGLNFPDYHTNEKTFNNFYKFLKIGFEGIIQTHHIENNTINALANSDYSQFIQKELKLRKENNFPPFCRLISLMYRDTNEEKARNESNKIYTELKKNLPQNIQILGPAPTYFTKKLNKFRYQIVLKVPLKTTLPEKSQDFLKKLDGWIVNFDPIELL